MPSSRPMQPSDTKQRLDLGRLLRMQAMVTRAAQVEATYQAGQALVRAYLSPRDEMLKILEPDALAELRAECQRLFPDIEDPGGFSTTLPRVTSARLAAAAHEAQLKLRTLQGWIQGLIDELTFEQRLRVEAEAKAAQASRPPLGFHE